MWPRALGMKLVGVRQTRRWRSVPRRWACRPRGWRRLLRPSVKKRQRWNRAEDQHQNGQNGLGGAHHFYLLCRRLPVKSVELRKQVGVLVEVLQIGDCGSWRIHADYTVLRGEGVAVVREMARLKQANPDTDQ